MESTPCNADPLSCFLLAPIDASYTIFLRGNQSSLIGAFGLSVCAQCVQILVLQKRDVVSRGPGQNDAIVSSLLEGQFPPNRHPELRDFG